MAFGGKLDEAQPSSPNESLVLTGGKIREVTYDPEEFKKIATGRIRYEILRKPFNAGGLPGYVVTLAVSALSDDGHIIKYEESAVLDPFEIGEKNPAKNTVDVVKEELRKTIEQFKNKAKTEFSAKPGRWC
jgi:hypothetical protein